MFQCSSASRKFLNEAHLPSIARAVIVSVLFSEPKIPQCGLPRVVCIARRGFSALQRAENSSMRRSTACIISRSLPFQCSSASRKFLNTIFLLYSIGVFAFQCSSASRKFLNCSTAMNGCQSSTRFSALQRAEIAEMLRQRKASTPSPRVSVLFNEPKLLKCVP